MSDESGRRRGLFLLVVGGYLLLSLGYGVVNPLFEAPDEHWHFFTTLAVARDRQLPRVTEPADPWLGQEAAQPPFYYVLGALIVAPVQAQGAREMVWPNPRLEVGDASAMHNVNAFVHGSWEAWPWHGYALAAHLLRIFSSLLGLGTLLFIHGSATQLWPERPGRALLALAMTAFLPQFLFVHSSVTNDVLITFFCAAAIWQLLRLWQGPSSAGRLVLLGLTVGLAILSKTAGILLLAYVCGVLLLLGLRRGAALWRTVLRVTSLVALPALAIGGWLLLRNWSLYGDPTAANQFVAIAGGDRGYTLGQVLGEWAGLWTSLFAVFGWFNVRAAPWVYDVWNGMVGLAIAGALWTAIGQRGRAGHRPEGSMMALWLALWVGLVYAALVSFMMRTPAAQGRLLFPALAPLALGMAYGLDGSWRALRRILARVSVVGEWLPERALYLAPLIALATSIHCLAVILPQTYRKPPLLSSETLPSEAVALRVETGAGSELLGYRLETEVTQPGDVAWMTLYWHLQDRDAVIGPRMTVAAPQAPQMIAPRTAAPQVVVELFGREERVVGKLQAYHGGGLYPITLWPEGAVVADRVGIRLQEGMQAPVVARVQVGLASSGYRVTLGGIEVEPVQWPAEPTEELASLGEAIRLVQAELSHSDVMPGDDVSLTLSWYVVQDVDVAYTTFVHLGQPGEQPLAQGDAEPLEGAYPTTHWEAGEVIVDDTYTLTVPPRLAPGRYPLLVGLYVRQDGRRVPLYVAGQRQEQDAFVSGWIDVR